MFHGRDFVGEYASHLKLFLALPDILVEFWIHPNPSGSFNGEPERAKMAAKPPFFASFVEKLLFDRTPQWQLLLSNKLLLEEAYKLTKTVSIP